MLEDLLLAEAGCPEVVDVAVRDLVRVQAHLLEVAPQLCGCVSFRRCGAADAVSFLRQTDFAPSSVAFDAAFQGSE